VPTDQYVAVEGIDGSGKTEVVRRVVAALRNDGRTVHVFPYMGRSDSLIGRFLDRHLFAGGSSAVGRVLDCLPTLKLLLFQMNAATNWRRLSRAESLRPSDIAIIVGDRSIVSASVIFPAAWRSWAMTRTLLRLTAAAPTPARIIYLAIPAEVAHERIQARSKPLANESVDALRAATLAYEAALDMRRWWFGFEVSRVDASRALDDVVTSASAAARLAFQEEGRTVCA
jgi:thymidylate kinase